MKIKKSKQIKNKKKKTQTETETHKNKHKYKEYECEVRMRVTLWFSRKGPENQTKAANTGKNIVYITKKFHST